MKKKELEVFYKSHSNLVLKEYQMLTNSSKTFNHKNDYFIKF